MLDGSALVAEQFVGRAGELARALAAIDAAARGRGSAVVVSGEPGIGKTWFCHEVAARARARGHTVVGARCWVDGGAPPLWPWQPLVGELCGVEAADLLVSRSRFATVDPERFARFVAVVDRLADACTRSSPCVVVIDDVHEADAGALLLARFVARSLADLPLVLLMSRRSGEPADGRVAELVDDIERDATSLVLGGLDIDEAAALVSGSSGGIDPGLVPVLHRMTGGNPLHLQRLRVLDAPAGGRDGAGGLRAAIDAAVSRLDGDVLATLGAGALLGTSPSVAETAAVAGVSPPAVLEAVQAAAAAGLAAGEGPDRFGFSHDLVRTAVEQRLPMADRLTGHARAAAVVARDGSPAHLARRARHALAASPLSPADARRAVEACRVAARSLVHRFAYEQADELLTAATELHESAELGRPPASLLVEWAGAALMCGRLDDGRRRFDRAVRVAQVEGDATTFAAAAIGLGGVWVNERRSRIERGWVLALQRAALVDLPEEEEGLRCRLGARLAAEAVYDGGPVEPVRTALAAARRCGHPDAVTEALSLCHNAMLAPEHLDERLALADELVAVASAHGRGTAALMGLCWRAADLFHLGDPQARPAFEELRQRADALACQSILYIVEAFDVMLAIRAGRLDEAEELAARCHDRGEAVGDVDAFGYLSAQLLAIRWLQGREAELVDLADRVASSPTLVASEFAFRATAAYLSLRAGRSARARAQLDELCAGGLSALPRSSTWAAGLHSVVETAHELGDAALAAEAYDLLVPFAGRPIMPSLGIVCLGSAERALGLAAETVGDVDRAVGHLDRAVAANRHLGNLPLVAMSQADLAGALRRRGGPGDVERAAGLLAAAAADADRMGMTARAVRWRADRADATPAAGGSARAAGARTGLIRRQGRGWLIGVDDRRALVGDLVGMGYLAELLGQPGRDVGALTLAGGGQTVLDLTRQPVVDAAARAAYAAHGRELAADLAEAEANADIGRAERLRVELDALIDQVESATGLGGRDRRFPGPAERARTAVRKAIKRALDEVTAAAPEIGDALRSTVSTGASCRYTPDPAAPITWSVDRRGGGPAGAAGHPG